MRYEDRRRSQQRSWVLRVSLLAIASLMLSACLAEGGRGGGSGNGGGGVPAGASKQEYIDAFENIAPITLQTQSSASPGAPASRQIEAYAKALKEWSGGRLTLEIAYGNSIASPDQAPQALADGRLDADYVYPIYEPSRYPANLAFTKTTVLGKHGPVLGTLQALAAFLEVGLGTPKIMQEMESNGVKMLLPYGPTSSVGLMCSDRRTSLAELQGAQVRVSAGPQSRQVEGLGMSPVSLPYSEVYQGLQRGTIDCALGTSWSAVGVGYLPLASKHTFDRQVGFARTTFALGFGMPKWRQLPLVAKQLLYDRLDVHIKTMLKQSIWGQMAKAMKTIRQNGGQVNEFDSGVQNKLRNVNSGMLDQVRGSDAVDGQALVQQSRQALKKWRRIIKDELGYPAAGYNQFLKWYRNGQINLQPFMDRLRREVLWPHRPS